MFKIFLLVVGVIDGRIIAIVVMFMVSTMTAVAMVLVIAMIALVVVVTIAAVVTMMMLTIIVVVMGRVMALVVVASGGDDDDRYSDPVLLLPMSLFSVFCPSQLPDAPGPQGSLQARLGLPRFTNRAQGAAVDE